MRHVWMAPIAAVIIAAAAWAGDCTCKTDATTDGWCGHCKLGHIDGVGIKSEGLYKAVAGHKVEADKVKCDGCKKALTDNGHCDACGVYFASGAAYKSKYAAELAGGKAYAADDVKCDGCKAAMKDHGWCEACKAGAVGPRVFTDKKTYEEAVTARAILVSAADAKCDGCAIAMMTDGKCTGCKVAYKAGKKVE